MSATRSQYLPQCSKDRASNGSSEPIHFAGREGSAARIQRHGRLRLRHLALVLCSLLVVLGGQARGNAQSTVATVTAGTNPLGEAVNPITNKIYIANQDERHSYGHQRFDQHRHQCNCWSES